MLANVFASTLVLLGIFRATIGVSCPDSWDANGNSCYYFGTRFSGMTWYDAAAFCNGLRAKLVELTSQKCLLVNDKGEHDFVASKVKSKSWSDGPWVGLVRIGDDEKWVLPSRGSKTGDGQFDNWINSLAKASSHDCGGMSKRGNDVGFWRCRNGGSPICEIEG